MTTTNQEKPFEPGENITFCGDTYEVVANHGSTGTVREPGRTTEISNFYWRFQGEDCRRASAE